MAPHTAPPGNSGSQRTLSSILQQIDLGNPQPPASRFHDLSSSGTWLRCIVSQIDHLSKHWAFISDALLQSVLPGQAHPQYHLRFLAFSGKMQGDAMDLGIEAYIR
jgi:hypothetical protein